MVLQESLDSEDMFRVPEDALKLMLKAECHRGEKRVTKKMQPYVFCKTADASSNIFDLHKTWQKIRAAALQLVAVHHKADVCLVAATQWGKRAIFKFGQYTGAYSISGRFTPGTFTNQSCVCFREPSVLLVCDPQLDSQAVREASLVNVPVIALCNTDTSTAFVDIAIPCNNKSKFSVAAVLYLLARTVKQMAGELPYSAPWGVKVDLFIFKSPEELEDRIASDKKLEKELEKERAKDTSDPERSPADVEDGDKLDDDKIDDDKIDEEFDAEEEEVAEAGAEGNEEAEGKPKAEVGRLNEPEGATPGSEAPGSEAPGSEAPAAAAKGPMAAQPAFMNYPQSAFYGAMPPFELMYNYMQGAKPDEAARGKDDKAVGAPEQPGPAVMPFGMVPPYMLPQQMGGVGEASGRFAPQMGSMQQAMPPQMPQGMPQGQGYQAWQMQQMQQMHQMQQMQQMHQMQQMQQMQQRGESGQRGNREGAQGFPLHQGVPPQRGQPGRNDPDPRA